jgi:alpha-tubulin suppressor-like RCC1 family protein
MAAALAALRMAARECAASAGRFSPEQSAEAGILANLLRALFSGSTTAGPAETLMERAAPLLPQLPTELIIKVLQHLDVRSLGRLACTCRQLYFGPPCPPRPVSLVETAFRRQASEEMRTVAAGEDRSFFVDANGALLACGTEDEACMGLLGLRGGTYSQTPFTAVVPTPVPSVVRVCIRSVASHDDCNLAVSKAGQVFAWGWQPPPDESDEWVGKFKQQPPVPTVMEELGDLRVRQVVAGGYHCAALTEDGALFTWEVRKSANFRPDELVPKLGYGNWVQAFGVPCRVLALASVRIVSVALGDDFTLAVTEAGAVYSFGVGGGQLGHCNDDVELVFIPKRVEALHGIRVASVAAGTYHALALTRCGRCTRGGPGAVTA